jgi:cell division protein ZapA
MPSVDITVNGRSYSLTCEAGEEPRLRELGSQVDRKVTALADSVGQIGDARLLLMAALLIAEEHQSAMQRLEAQAQTMVDLAKSEETAVQALDRATRRVEDIAARLAAA